MMRPGAYILAFDLGTSGLKLAVTTLRGEIVGTVVEPYPLHLLGDGGAEQDPEDWWRAVVRGTRHVLASSGVDASRVVGVGCSAQWSGTVPVDRDGRPLTRALIWMDSRGAEQVRRITRDLPDGRAQVGDRHLNFYESWDNLNDRSGVAFRAARIEPVVAQAKAS